ncbi:MAG: type III secretion system outer membrane ring subunit SctC [Oxalobacteraceae bacterium]|jgi:type III secretion protein C|nr:type III secretion system outer membrane ring subunit SctC [Oxalobacteraceae bacterium]
MYGRLQRFIGSLCMLMMVTLGQISLAAPVPWQDVTFTYIADNQDLSKVLSSFARTFGLELQLSSAVSARRDVVNGKLTTTSPTEFLNQLSSTYGLQWFYFGGTLYISRNFENATRSIAANGISLANFRKALTDLGIVETKFGWGEVPDRGVAMVSGPPAYVDLVAWAVATMPLPQPEQQIRVFRLRHAQVSDRTISYRDQQITTPGVATILRNLTNPDASRSQGSGGTGALTSQISALAAPLKAVSTVSDGKAAETTRGNESGNADTPPTQSPQTELRLRTVIQADPRLNAIVIRDTTQRLQVFEELIALLDVPSRLVEIEAIIVDVNSSRVSELGIDWGARVGNVAGGFGRPSVLPDAFTATAVLGQNVNPTTVIPNAGNFLMTRIRALEGNGDAKIVSRPSVLTVDNLGALIDLSDTFYVQAVGERVASVVPISVGTTLKVTPHIIESGGTSAVHLVVDIEDGSIQDERKFQNLPTIRRSVIGTQAVMGVRESLLIGGFNSESDTKQTDAVPLLGSIPFFGAFFKKKSSTLKKTERLFLITPKIVAEPIPHASQGG